MAKSSEEESCLIISTVELVDGRNEKSLRPTDNEQRETDEELTVLCDCRMERVASCAFPDLSK
ncbi:MAG: hypothetical protein M1812_003514 [Candelaria pacifica]|nr:MAG: hypothetical protein M1812_003514 [Candelaria pacifica]